MSDRDILAELRAWRDEFARSHGYDLAAMAAAIRELDTAAGSRVVRGEPRRPIEARSLPEPAFEELVEERLQAYDAAEAVDAVPPVDPGSIT